MVGPILEAKHLELSYGRQKVVSNVSLQLYPGRVLALIGPNGAGKSSIMRMIAGLVMAEKGDLFLEGRPVSTYSEIHGKTGFFIEGPDFYKNLTALQNLNLLKMVRKAEQPAAGLLQVVGLGHAGKKKVRKFSNGMKQRLGIAQALLGDPSILILDEPFNGLDPEVKQFLMNLIRKLAKEDNKAILVSSHLLADMEVLADDFVLLSEGAVHAAGRLADFKNEKNRVKFWFETEPPSGMLAEASEGRMVSTHPWCWEARLDTSETAALVSKWVSAGFAPYEIQREDLLHSKYLEIIK